MGAFWVLVSGPGGPETSYSRLESAGPRLLGPSGPGKKSPAAISLVFRGEGLFFWEIKDFARILLSRILGWPDSLGPDPSLPRRCSPAAAGRAYA